jgi:HK97 family phage portal protein
MGLFTRSIRPPAETPNDNDALTAAPGSVGPPNVNPGDPQGVVFDYTPPDPPSFTRIVPSAWSGWPAEWLTPNWSGRMNNLSDTAWMCLDLNASVLSTMPPYLVNASASLNADWLINPSPGIYSSWEEFMKSFAWDFMLGEAFVLATAYYSTGWPSRFHLVPPWLVNVEMSRGRRVYSIGEIDVTGDILHVRYQSSVDNARGVGPLEAGRYRLLAAEVLSRYATTLASNGLIPSSILEAPVDLTPDQAASIRDDWVQQRAANPGYPAVLSGGLKWTPTQLNPKDLALLELSSFNESRIAVLLGVPPFLVGLPSGGDSMTYSNVSSIFDYHWRAGLRPKAQTLMSALSGWALPRGTSVELNRDEYVQPGPLERAQTAQILNSIVDPETGRPVLSVDEIRGAERLDNSTPQDLASGVLK